MYKLNQVRTILPYVIFLLHVNLFAQIRSDSAVFSNSFAFKDGIYTCIEELKNNSPWFPNCELDLDKNNEVINTQHFYYINSRQTRLQYLSPLYATVVDGHLSIFYKNELSAVFLKGAISTFILKEVVTTTQYQPMNNMGYGYPGSGQSVPVTTSHVEVNIYFLDFKTGTIAKVEKDNLAPIIKRDAVLYESFRKIKGDSNHKKSYPYISQYNTRNPFYISILPIQNAEEDE